MGKNRFNKFEGSKMNLKQKLGIVVMGLGLVSTLHTGNRLLRNYDQLCESRRHMKVSDSEELVKEFNMYLKEGLIYHGLYVGAVTLTFGGVNLLVYDKIRDEVRGEVIKTRRV